MTLPEALNIFGMQLFMMGYFVLLCAFVFCLVNWIAFQTTASTFYDEHWMAPTVLLGSTFLAGAFMRQTSEDVRGGLGQFIVAIFALALFAYLTYLDLQTTGGVFSKFMPKALSSSLFDYIYAIPMVGMLGMIFFKYFTLKNY